LVTHALIAMARYYFRVRDGDTLLKDDGEAEDLPNLKAVRVQAIESARQILSEAVLRGTAGSLRQQIEVMDASGRTVLTMPVGNAVGTASQT
jgi:uncharacterized protein DUF6894